MKRHQGLGVSSGVASGKVIVSKEISLPDDFPLGSILVLEFPDLIRVMDAIQKGAAAIISESGSRTTHGCVLAKAANIPCVVSVERATEVFASGESVIVNADTGVIEVLQSNWLANDD